jgi:thiosulfate/3-mercaptopyruvate sulfurtransferase
MFKTLISSAELSLRINDPGLAVVDCRFKLDDPSWGEREYRAAHLPGAVYAHLDRDLSGAKSGTNGRHPLPDAASLAGTFGRLGISDDTQVVAYDQDNGMFASRLWWLLRWLGHDGAAVLDGGFAQWAAEGRPTASGQEFRAARVFHGGPRRDMTVDADRVASISAAPDWRLVDARAPERYRGEVERLDRVAGHIPGASNYFFGRNVDDRGRFLPLDTLRKQLQESFGGVPPDQIVCYCGSGVTACQNLLALEHVGIAGAKLYPGSWSEWCSDPERPVASAPAKRG